AAVEGRHGRRAPRLQLRSLERNVSLGDRSSPTTGLRTPSGNEVPTMTHQWDEFSKSLAEPVPRRESLRRLGFALAGVALSPLGTAWAAPKRRVRRGKDPCPTFCKCRNTRQQSACLAACSACNGDTRRLYGTCGSYVCCGDGQTGCGGICTDLTKDV